ncbi:MAG: acylphosphatase [Patescibacteria group bacterium]
MIRHADIIIQGLVQGISFRAAAHKKAKSLGLKGYVRNLEDGSVFIEAEGEDRDVKKFIIWCHVGTELSRIDKVRFEFTRDFEYFREFTVE